MNNLEPCTPMTTEVINQIIFNNMGYINTNDIYDGQHTFGSLYFQRMMLFATLVNLFPHFSWKTKRHEDGEKCFGGGWFLVTIETPAGAYGYHYEEKYWDYFKCDELDKAKPWDGYTDKNVDRLFSLTAYYSWIQFVNKQYFTKHETKECSFCKGTGMSTPFTPEIKCVHCNGKGVIEND